VGSAWATPFPRLLIFDNCEDETLVDAWAPKSGGCRLVITARRPSWSPARGITVVPLGRLARAESLALLHRHRADLGPDDPGLSGIADELGDLPLALELAGSYLARYRHEPIGSPAAYLAELRGADLLAHISLTNEHPEPPDPARSLTGHERDVARTFEVSLRRLQREDPVDAFALEILARASWLAPLPIPRRLLKLCVGLPPEEADAARRFTDGLDRLLKLAFVDDASEATGAVLVHRLVAAFARARVKDAGVARRALENAIVEEAYRVLPQKDPRPFRDWAGHLLAVALAAARDGTEAAIDLLNAAGLYSWMVADYEASEAMLRDVVERIQALHGPQNTMVANILDNLSSVQLERGDLANAEASTTRALDIKEKAYGRDHPQVAGTLSNLGNVQRARDKLANAEAHLARALAIDEKVYGPDSPEVARPLVNLALVQARQGDRVGAEASLTRALEIYENVYGASHPDLAQAVVNLASVQARQGDPASAEVSLTRALGIYENVYGPDHPALAHTLIRLGGVQRDRGDLDGAEISQSRALMILENVYGPDHAEVGRTLINLGSVQRDRGDLANAEASMTRAVAITEKIYGPDHPEVARALGNLVEVQTDRNDLAGAEANLARALAIDEKIYGPDNPEVAGRLNNLALVQARQGNLGGAETILLRALTIEEKVYGPDHAEVGVTLGNRGMVQLQRGDLAGAEVSQSRALKILENVYGPDHAEVGRTLCNVGNVQCLLSRLSDARKSYTRAAVILAARLGEQSPMTVLARQKLNELDEAEGGDNA
jgi:Tfp pilus assembly protein PilF